MEESIDLRLIIKETHKHQIVIGYFIMKLVQANSFLNIYCWYAIETICIFIMYRRAKNIYRSFKLMDFALTYEYQVKIIDIILNQIIVAHFIVNIILFRQLSFIKLRNSGFSRLGSTQLESKTRHQS